MEMLSSARAILLLLLAAATGAATDTPLAVTVGGDSFQGTLLSADAAGQAAFQTKDGRKEIPIAQLVRWGKCVEPDRSPLLLLHDGTILVAGILEAEGDNLAVDSEALGLLRLPLRNVAAIVLHLPASSIQRDRLLDTALRNEQDAARVVMLNGDVMRGKLAALDDRSVSLRTAVGPVQLEFDRVSTVTLAQEDRVQRETRQKSTLVGLADGTRAVLTAFAIQAETATLTTVGGLAWKCDAREVVFLQPTSPRIVYLSDITPSGYRHVPYLELTWKFRTDRNVLGGIMRCGGQMYLKGLGMHTAARISYVPPQKSKAFQASLGIDDVTDGMGSVRFRVFVDGSEKYVSPTVRGLEEPLPISVEVTGAQRLDLVVDFADRADVQDQANWLDARFVLAD